MALYYINQNQSVKALREWAKQNNLVMRKCNVLLGGSKAYKLYNKLNDKAVSRYFTLDDVTKANNFYDGCFNYLIE